MLILRMISGLAASAWGLLRPRGGGPKKNRVAERLEFFRPEPFEPVPVQWIAMTGRSGDPYLDAAREMWSGTDQDKLGKAAAWHAKAARRAVIDLDGEGALQHMRHFRRYSSELLDRDADLPSDPQWAARTCSECGSTCAPRDMHRSPEEFHLPEGPPVCEPCSGQRNRPLWTAKDGRRIPVAEMDDDHLVNSARMVRRWLASGARPVNDDRVRMCGHVLVECGRRGMLGEVRNG